MAEGYIAGGSWGGPVEFTPTGFASSGVVDSGSWTQPQGWWERNFGDVSSKDLVSALNAAGKTASAQTDKDPGFLSPQSAAPGQPMRRVSIDQLAQMLNKQRDTLYASAMTPGGKAEPVIPNRTIGLLGF